MWSEKYIISQLVQVNQRENKLDRTPDAYLRTDKHKEIT